MSYSIYQSGAKKGQLRPPRKIKRKHLSAEALIERKKYYLSGPRAGQLRTISPKSKLSRDWHRRQRAPETPEERIERMKYYQSGPREGQLRPPASQKWIGRKRVPKSPEEVAEHKKFYLRGPRKGQPRRVCKRRAQAVQTFPVPREIEMMRTRLCRDFLATGELDPETIMRLTAFAKLKRGERSDAGKRTAGRTPHAPAEFESRFDASRRDHPIDDSRRDDVQFDRQAG